MFRRTFLLDLYRRKVMLSFNCNTCWKCARWKNPFIIMFFLDASYAVTQLQDTLKNLQTVDDWHV